MTGLPAVGGQTRPTDEQSTSDPRGRRHVYLGGAQHFLHRTGSGLHARAVAHRAQNNGGDFQAIAYNPRRQALRLVPLRPVPVPGHHHFYDPTDYSRVDQINLIGAYDTNNNLRRSRSSTRPTPLNGSDGEGPWALFFDSNGCMWAGGDLSARVQPPSPYYGGFEKFCDRDTRRRRPRRTSRATIAGNNVTLAGTRRPTTARPDPVRDPQGRPDLRHDRRRHHVRPELDRHQRHRLRALLRAGRSTPPATGRPARPWSR